MRQGQGGKPGPMGRSGLVERKGNAPPRSKRRLAFCLLAVASLLTACAGGRIRDGIYVNEAKGFALQLPSNAWNVERGGPADLVLRHVRHQAGLVVNGTCGEVPPDRPLMIVSRHFFFGIQGKEILREDRRTAAQGEAVEVVLQGELEGRQYLLHGYTLKGARCVYDLVLFAGPEAYADVNAEFEVLVRRFQFLNGSTR